jgi:hypothetical protein
MGHRLAEQLDATEADADALLQRFQLRGALGLLGS